jgi:hypothetical protein
LEEPYFKLLKADQKYISSDLMKQNSLTMMNKKKFKARHNMWNFSYTLKKVLKEDRVGGELNTYTKIKVK